MSGKGSKPRPLSVSQNEFDKQWDLIFGGKNMKRESDGVSISEYNSRDGIRKAIVKKNENGYYVEFFENNEPVKSVDVSTKSIHFAEDVAENYVLGIINSKESMT